MNKKLEEIFLSELEKNKESLLRLCSIYAPDSDTKRDFFQESLLNIWKSMPSFKGDASLKTWMYRITINVCLGLEKRQTKYDFVDITNLSLEKDYFNDLELPDYRLEKLHNCISKLKETEKTLIGLYLEELSYKEISAITGLTENHIAVKLKRIRKKLFNCINQIV